MTEKILHPSISQANALSAVDFRSDTVTSPTASMLQAMISSAVGDDVYSEDETTANLEKHVADLLGHEAGLFVPSGTAGNQIAIRVHLTQPPHSVLCHARSHINQYEAGGIATLSQAMVQPVWPSKGPNLTLEDVKRGLSCGMTSIQPQLVLSPSRIPMEGIGAPIGSVLVGSKTFIDRARWIRKSIGGGMRQTGVIAGAARVALDEVFPKLAATHEIARDIEKHLHSLGLKTVLPVETNMIFIDLEAAGLDNDWLVEEAKNAGLKLGYDGRIVVHHQISTEAVQKLKEVLSRVMEKKAAGVYAEGSQARTNGGAYGGRPKRT
ncbi:threonine aldolase [Rhizoctonia solani]|uniref:Threonine aldolase n=1 Tax=Rhizoctonia solani TaxID=456999 RepID=A0A8H8NSB2_9AGAM|nr:threonine aldolase [Rhizoctonia solani]QRW17715.1 threonine aldolase [Rhizoctonia solani]